MALTDAIVGAKRPSPTVTWASRDGTILNLTGATITAIIKNLNTGVSVASTGTFTVTDAVAGQFRWDYSDADVTTAGDYEVQFNAAFGSAPTPARNFITSWKIYPALVVSS